MKRNSMVLRHGSSLAAALLLTAGGAATAAAQLPSPSAAALGVGDNYTALARGFNATSWNPAGLGMPGNPVVSFGLLSTRGIQGLDPISLKDLKDYQDAVVPAAVRQEWLNRITTEGSEQGTAGADLSYLSVSVGRVGVQIATTARAVANLNPGAAELLLFGNAGRTGTATNLALSGSSFDMSVVTTAALAYAQPIIRTPEHTLAIGATLKYSFGQFAFSGMDNGGQVTANPLALNVQFPLLVSDTATSVDDLNKGSGIGLDLGLAYQAGPWTAGAVAKNVFNTFKWDESALFFRPGQALFTGTTRNADFDPQPFANSPQSLQERINDQVGGAEFAVGVGFKASRRVQFSADAQQRTKESNLGESKTHIGAGVELRPLHWLPIRAGGAILDGGSLGSVGVGLEFGTINLTASAAQRKTDLGTDNIAMFTFSSMRVP
jgi:hypothetical protein